MEQLFLPMKAVAFSSSIFLCHTDHPDTDVLVLHTSVLKVNKNLHANPCLALYVAKNCPN